MLLVQERQPDLRYHDPQIDVSHRQSAIEVEAQVRTEALYRRVGSVVFATETTQAPPVNLHEASKRATQGDPEGYRLVKANAKTDYIERMIKAGHVMKVRQEINGAGQIVQYGQTAEQIQENTLRYANNNLAIKERTRSEIKNAFQIEGLAQSGLLEDHYVVVVSLCPDLEDKTLDDLHFFSFTKSLVIQATTQDQDGIVTESAFIAGVEQEGALRRDHIIAEQFGATFGKNWQGMDAAEIISQTVLIPKGDMSNGVIDLVKIWDDLAGGTFFGQAKPRQDYVRYLETCWVREKAFEPVVQRIVDEFISLASSINNPSEATKMLDEISGKHAIDSAVTDRSIDPRVFGAKAALDLAEARFHYDQGNIQQFNLAMKTAHRHNKSGSCPSGTSRTGDNSPYNEDGTLKSPEQIAAENLNPSEDSDQFGSLSFLCQRGHRNTRPRGKLIPKCKHCGITVGCGRTEASPGKRPNKTTPRAMGSLLAPAFWQKLNTAAKPKVAFVAKSMDSRQDYGLAS